MSDAQNTAIPAAGQGIDPVRVLQKLSERNARRVAELEMELAVALSVIDQLQEPDESEASSA